MWEDKSTQIIKDGTNVVKELKSNIERLKLAYTRLKEENDKLFQDKQELLNQLNEKDQHISELKKQIEKLKVTNALILSGENTDTENLQEIKRTAKIKLNQIIREIDTVIKQLSTFELQ